MTTPDSPEPSLADVLNSYQRTLVARAQLDDTGTVFGQAPAVAFRMLVGRLDDRPRKWAVWAVTGFICLWVLLVLGRTQHWLAFSLLENGRD